MLPHQTYHDKRYVQPQAIGSCREGTPHAVQSPLLRPTKAIVKPLASSQSKETSDIGAVSALSQNVCCPLRCFAHVLSYGL